MNLLIACCLLMALVDNVSAQTQTVQIASAKRDDASNQPADMLLAYLAKPVGSGPFPAVVALHGCGGMSPRFKQEMLDRWTGWGYVALVVDSFANHEVKYACGSSRERSRAHLRPLDAQGAMAYLAERCVEMKRRTVGKGAIFELVVYPEATHAFDWIDLREPRRVEGYLMQYNEAAALNSLNRHRQFIHEQMSKAVGR